MDRIVIDTNVFISSFFGGKPKKIIDVWKDGQFVLCLSAKIIEEYVLVLNRFLGKYDDEIEELLKIFSSGYNSIFVKNPKKLDIVKDDPDDNKFIECAVALKAKYIISGDVHLKSLGSYFDIKILSPAEFLDINN